MHNLPFNTVSLAADDVQALEDAYNALKAKFKIGLPDSKSPINKFELFNNGQAESVSGTLLLNSPATDCYLSFVKVRSQFTAGRTHLDYLKCQSWAFVDLKHDFGRVLIRRETFTDKVLQLVNHIELKFKDDKVFSSNFYVVTNDAGKANAAITQGFRDVIKDNMYSNFVIEIIGNILVIRNSQPVDTEQTVNLAEFACKIAALGD